MNGLYLFLLLGLSGCGTLQKWAMRSSTPVFQKSSEGLMKESDWEFFRKGAPGNLKFVELLWEQDRENLGLLSVLIKGYAGYAFAVPETLAYGNELAQVETSKWKKAALTFYTRALDYGVLYLSEKGISRENLLGNETKLMKELKDKLDDEDVTALLYTAQAWGSLINLQKDNVALVSQIPKVKAIFDHVCSMKPDIDHNVCDIFYAQYEAARPRMLGGDPVKAENLYLTAIKRHPRHLLLRVSYLQYMAIPAYDEAKYERVAQGLREEFEEWGDLKRDGLKNESPYREVPELNLYNAIAKKRFELMEKNKSKIF